MTTVIDDLETIRNVLARAATGTVKHHEVSLALQSLERVEEGCKFLARQELARVNRPGQSFECGRCLQLHEGESFANPITMREEIPEHSPRCPMREERASAWDAGYATACADYSPYANSRPDDGQNPHR